MVNGALWINATPAFHSTCEALLRLDQFRSRIWWYSMAVDWNKDPQRFTSVPNLHLLGRRNQSMVFRKQLLGFLVSHDHVLVNHAFHTSQTAVCVWRITHPQSFEWSLISLTMMFCVYFKLPNCSMSALYWHLRFHFAHLFRCFYENFPTGLFISVTGADDLLSSQLRSIIRLKT